MTSIDQQYASVERNLAQASAFDADIGAFVSAKTVSEVLQVEVRKVALTQSGPDLQIDKFTPRVRLVPQGIAIDASFDVQAVKQKVVATGKLQGVIAISTVDDRILLRPALEAVEFAKLRPESGPVKPDLAKVVNVLIRNFVTNLNGALASRPIVVDLNWSHVTQVDLASLNSNPDMTITADRKALSRKFDGSLIHIDENGLSVLVAISDAPVTQEEVEFSPLQKVNSTSDQLRTRFREYSTVFRQRWEERLDPMLAQSPVEAYVSKVEIASLLNTVTDQAIGLRYHFNLPVTQFNEKVEAAKSKIDCQKVYEPFRRERYDRDSCNWNCQRCVNACPPFRCRVCTDEPFCLSTRAACNVREETRVLKDNIQYELEKAQHIVDQEARVAACNVWRETTSILAVGRFAGGFKGKGQLVANTAGIQFDPMLEYADLKKLEAKVSGKAALGMKITPHDLGHVFLCMAPASVDWNGQYEVQVPSATRRINVTSMRDGGDLVLQVLLPDIDFKAAVSPSPIEALLTDKDFLVNCGVGATVLIGAVPIAEAAGILGLRQGSMISEAALGRYSGTQKLGQFEQRIKPVSIEIEGRAPIVVEAAMGAKSILLRAPNKQ